MKGTRLTATARRAVRGLLIPRAGETVVVALSGGADSVALLDAMRILAGEEGFLVVAAHLDHQLRPDSGEDVAFCEALCRSWGISLRVGAADVKGRAARDHGGLEEAARRERYSFLRSVKEEVGAVAIAVAHTRDDQAETFLLRLLRGSGSPGLASMRPRSGDIVRPLLGAGREDVLAHLSSRGFSWREDPTNADLGILRNRVRLELVPYLEGAFNPAIRETLARTAGLLSDEVEVLRDGAEALLRTALSDEVDGIHLDRAALGKAPRALSRLALRGALERTGGLRGVTAAHIDRVLDLSASAAPSGRRLPLPGGREALFRFGKVHLALRRSPAVAYALPLDVPGRVGLPGGLTLEARSGEGASRSWERAVVPATGALVVRTRRPGDRVFSAGRERSLKRFLMERRVPADLRGRLPLVACGDLVLFVPGQPLDPSLPGGRVVHVELRAS